MVRETYRISVFHKTLIVATQAHEEENASDILKAVYPFPSFAFLSTDVHHQHFMISK